MTSPRRRALKLPPTGASTRKVFRRRHRPDRWRQAVIALLLGAAGVVLMLALLQLPERFDTFLVLSTALANLIGGLQRALWGLLQLVVVVLLVLAAIAALGLVVAGIVRLVRALGPQPSRRN